MPKMTNGLLMCAVVLAYLTGCSESRNDQCDEVERPCAEGGAQQCSADSSAVETCIINADGCRQWLESEDCGTGVCDDSSGAPLCNGGDCEDECDAAGDMRCDRRTIEACETGDDGCLDWVLDEDCGAADQSCSEAGGEPECVEGCGDECEPHDAEQCDGTRIERCSEDADSCWLWEQIEDCADSGEVCDDSGADVACVRACSDDCTTEGESRCSVNVIQTCEPGDDGCLDWIDGRNCEDDSLFCDDSSGTADCTDTCTSDCTTAGATQCDGTVIQDCAVGAGDCLYWFDGVDCDATDQVCEESSSGAACADICTDACSAAGDSQCSGTTIQACEVGALGCLEWVDGTDCSATDELCDDSGAEAICTDSCSDTCPADGDTRCVINMLQTCEINILGCLAWADTTDCEAGGELCVMAGSDALCMCLDECAASESQCLGDVVQTCEHVDGCWSWVDDTDCSTFGLPCDDGSGTAACLTGDGDDCSDPIVVTGFPYVLSGSDFGADFTDAQTFSDGSCEDRPGEPEAVFAVTVAAGATLIMMESDAIDVAISVQSACDPTSPCDISVDHLPGGGLRYTVPADGTYYVVVEESYGGGEAYEISIDVIEPEECGDGIDNDGDGDIDCDDADCFGEPTHCTTELNCEDGADNDDDGDTDCDDADCIGEPACLPYQGVYERFDTSEDIDLAGRSIVFTPDAASPDGYSWTTSTITDFPETPGTGTSSTTLALGDDDFEEYTFAQLPDFDFYGVTYTSMFVSSNGFITFDSGNDDYSPSTADFFDQPVIAGLWTDLNPGSGGGGGGTVTVDDSADRIVVTFEGVPRFEAAGVNDFQIILSSDGSIEIAILTVSPPSSRRATFTGISSGTGTGMFPPDTDFVP